MKNASAEGAPHSPLFSARPKTKKPLSSHHTHAHNQRNTLNLHHPNHARTRTPPRLIPRPQNPLPRTHLQTIPQPHPPHQPPPRNLGLCPALGQRISLHPLHVPHDPRHTHAASELQTRYTNRWQGYYSGLHLPDDLVDGERIHLGPSSTKTLPHRHPHPTNNPRPLPTLRLPNHRRNQKFQPHQSLTKLPRMRPTHQLPHAH